MTRFILIRHGATDLVASGPSGTQPGIHLNDLGRAQAEQVADALKGVALAAVISSPLERARETAIPIAARHGLDVEPNIRLTEFEVGDWTGQSFVALESDLEWKRFNVLRSLTRPPSGELMLEVQERAIGALLTLDQRYTNGIVAVVTHADVIRAALLYVLGMPMDFFYRIEISLGRLSVLEFGGGMPRLLQMNSDTLCPVE
jgi:probable phosphoglycerate mutase